MSTTEITKGQKISAIFATKLAAIIEEIEFLTSCDMGEAGILQAIGYTRNPLALKRRLERANRHDLIPRIFEWEAELEERQHPKGWAKAA